MSRFLYSLSLALIVALGIAACTEPTAGAGTRQEGEEAVTMRKTCVKTACQSINEMRDRGCSKCREECGSLDGCSAADVCDASCTSEPCSADLAAKCDETAWTADLPTTPTPGLAQACLDVGTEFSTRCDITRTPEGIARTEATCNRDARILTEAALPLYACVASIGCKLEGADECAAAPSDFGDQVCAAIDVRCPSHGQLDGVDLCERLNGVASLLKPSMLDAARQCSNQLTCEDITGCLSGWWQLMR